MLFPWSDRAGLQLYQLRLSDPAWTEHSDLRQGPADHGDLVASVQTRAGLAVFVNLVRQGGAINNTEAEVKEEIRDAGEETDRSNLLLFGLFEEGAEESTACTLAFGFGFDDDRADFGEVRAVEVKGTAAKEDTGFGFGYSEVADVLADLGIAATQKGSIAGEGVDEVEDVDSVGELSFADDSSASTEACRHGRLTDGGLEDGGHEQWLLFQFRRFDRNACGNAFAGICQGSSDPGAGGAADDIVTV
jgi:hypothetical protein